MPVTEGNVFLKAKNEEKIKKMFLYCLDQKQFWQFLENYKIYKKNNFEYSL